MKKLLRPVLLMSLCLLIALVSVAVTDTIRIPDPAYSNTAAYYLQDTPTPSMQEDSSVVGSTDGIIVMGGVITLIVLVPILMKRRSWMPPE